MSNVVNLNGEQVPEPGEPNPALVSMLEDLLEHARTGRLQSFIGTGFTTDNGRVSVWCDGFDLDVWSMMGAIAWLQHEYARRHDPGVPIDGD